MLARIYSLLLVDDEEANRLLLSRRLEQEGYAVTGAQNGKIALDMMNVEHFDLVLLDMNMPVMDGLCTLDAIKSDPHLGNTPVVMLTATNSRENVIQCLSLGAADYIIKPANPVDLKLRVKRCLDKTLQKIEPTMRIASADLTGSKILIVDDEPLNLMLLERRLAQVGFSTHPASRGAEALDILLREEVDAVLLDLNLPDMDGAAVLSEIREAEKFRHLPVLMLSAEGEGETVERCYRKGASDYLVKPYQTNDLYMRLAVAIEIARASL